MPSAQVRDRPRAPLIRDGCCEAEEGLGALKIMKLNNPEYWRSRAEEARAVAVQMSDAHTKAVMLGVAQDYEKLAERAEQRARNAQQACQV
jgi:hypothetical protein